MGGRGGGRAARCGAGCGWTKKKKKLYGGKARLVNLVNLSGRARCGRFCKHSFSVHSYACASRTSRLRHDVARHTWSDHCQRMEESGHFHIYCRVHGAMSHRIQAARERLSGAFRGDHLLSTTWSTSLEHPLLHHADRARLKPWGKRAIMSSSSINDHGVFYLYGWPLPSRSGGGDWIGDESAPGSASLQQQSLRSKAKVASCPIDTDSSSHVIYSLYLSSVPPWNEGNGVPLMQPCTRISQPGQTRAQQRFPPGKKLQRLEPWRVRFGAEAS